MPKRKEKENFIKFESKLMTSVWSIAISTSKKIEWWRERGRDLRKMKGKLDQILQRSIVFGHRIIVPDMDCRIALRPALFACKRKTTWITSWSSVCTRGKCGTLVSRSLTFSSRDWRCTIPFWTGGFRRGANSGKLSDMVSIPWSLSQLGPCGSRGMLGCLTDRNNSNPLGNCCSLSLRSYKLEECRDGCRRSPTFCERVALLRREQGVAGRPRMWGLWWSSPCGHCGSTAMQ